MALTDLTRISTSGIATGSTIDAAILRKDVSFRGSQIGVTSSLFDSSENELKFNDNVKLKFGDGGDLQLYWTGSAGFVTNQGAAGSNLHFNSDTVLIKNAANSKSHIRAYNNSSVEIFYNNNKKIETTKHGAVVTGILTATSFSGPLIGSPINNPSGISTFYDLRVVNNLTVEGTTTTLDTNLIGVDRVEVGANSNTLAGIAVTQSGTADLVRLYDGASQVVTVDDVGRVGLGSAIPAARLDVSPTIQIKNTASNGNANLDINAANGGQARINLYAGVSGGANRATRIDFHNQGNTPQWTIGNDFAQNGTNYFSIRHGSENAIQCNPDATVSLYDDGDESLRTDATGILIPEKVIHLADPDTYLQFTTNTINLHAGGTTGLSVLDSSVRVPTKLGINGAAPQTPLDVIANGSGYAMAIRGRSSDNIGEIRFTSNDYGTLYGQIVTGPTYLQFNIGGNQRLKIDSNGTPFFYSPGTAWAEGPVVLEASNGYGAIFFRSTGSTHGTSTTGTWSVGKLNGSNGFAILKNGMTGGGASRGDAALQISNTGNTTIGKYLGIGVAPATILHVKANVGDMLRLDRNNTGAVGNQIAFRHSNSGTLTETGSINCVSTANADTGELKFYTKASGGSNAEKLRITPSGQLVIGTGAAASLLTLRSSGSTEITLVGGDSTDSGIYFNDGTNDGAVSYHHGSRELRFRSGSQNRLVIGTNGALTSTGSEAKLSLTNSGSNATEQTATLYTSNSGTHNRVVIKTYTNSGGDPYIKFDAGGQDMVVGTRYEGTTNNLLVMGPGLDPDTITSGIFVKGTGNVGIGYTNPGEKLDVSGAVQASQGYKTAGHPVLTYASFTDISGGSYATRLGSTGTSTLRHTQIYGGGNHIATFDGVNYRVGIGSVVPAQTLDVKGTIVESRFAGSHSSGTIKKIFIYDTRMDSDGGAWRKSERIKTTSWYTETLGTSTRGTRAEFPVVAVLVLENYKLTIYDGDDPSMPMWMVFNRGNDNPSTSWWDGNNSNYGTDIHMLNGYMFMTTHAAGSYTANFISEEMRNYYVTTYSGARTGNTIADRNSNAFAVRMGQDNIGSQATGQYAQSVDMIVMDNSKVDPQTGLKQPHVLLGCSNDTGNHICVIGDDQLVLVRRTGSWQATGGCYEARFDHVHGGYWHSTGYHPETNSSYPNHGGSIGYTDIVKTSGGVPTMNVNTRSMYIIGQGKGKDNTPPQLTGTYQHEGSYWTSGSVCNFWLPNAQDANLGKANIARNGKYIGTKHGLLVMSHHLEEFGEQWNSSHTKAERTGQARKSLHAYIYKDSATGYLFGNDKGCYGHSTSTTSLQGWTSSSPQTNNLVTDPTFEDGANWTTIQESATVTHDTNANVVTCTSSGGSNVYSFRKVTGLTSGQRYLFRLDYKRPSGTSSTGIVLNSLQYNQGTSYAGSNSLPTKNNVYRTMSMEFEAPGSDIFLNVYAQGTIVLDNFFIMSANGYERSLAYPARGAQVYGTVTRTAVASGAELTMLGNTDSSANYLLEKNIDIDFSQDWYLMCWCPKGTGKVSIEEFNTDASYNDTVAMITMANGNESSVRYAGSPLNSHTNQHYKFHCVTHEGATNTTRYYVGPGHLLQSGTQANWSSSKEADLHIGRGSYNNQYSHTAGGSNTGVSLVRYGQGLPQKEHLEKIYYDELKLMQPNAKCTLYGTSNDIRAIAWDKCTDITHVGTSSGRSDFLGLERINNTTTGVGEGMDAKNGLIVEAN